MSIEVDIQEYSPEWNIEFEREKLKIQRVLNDKAVSIEHIGSH